MQRSFAGGEIGPTLYGGADLPLYMRALATCRNFIVRRNGGVDNRAGLGFLAEVKDSDDNTHLLPFVFDTTDTYAIEAGDLYFRFYKNGARVTTGSVTAWSAMTAYVVGDLASRLGVNYYCILGHTNQQPPNATYWYPLTDDILEVPTPYAHADIANVQWNQNGDIVTLTHKSYPVYELRRTGSRWTMTPAVFAPGIAAPANLAATAGTAGSRNYSYKVTAIMAETYEESLPSSADDCACAEPTPAAPNTLAWDAVSGAVEYNIYRDSSNGNGIWYFVGISSTNAFKDLGYVEDESLTPPVAQTVFNTAGEYPGSVAAYQQRRVLGGTTNEPEKNWASVSGFFKNFTVSSPVQDDDAVSFTIAGKLFSAVRHILEVAHALVILTLTGEWVVHGDENRVLRPQAINLRQQSAHGASTTPPVIAGNNLIFAQARGGIVRDLRFNYESEGYEGRDLTIFANHLFEGFTIDRMAYAQSPNSIVWCVRSDGTLLGLTYLREFDVWGWHRHDSQNGLFKSVVCIPEVTPAPPGSSIPGKEEDYAYFIVEREIDGETKKYVERMASRRFDDYRLDGYFLDSFLTYNGINAAATTVTLSTGGGWTTADTITVTASANSFTAGDVGNGITVWIPGGAVTRIMVTGYTSATVVTGTPIATVDPSLRGVALTTWSRAVDEVDGLDHLEGETVSILANGLVVSNKVVSSGAVTLDAVADIIHVGLPIEADFETLDLESEDPGLRDKKKLVKSASLLVVRSRGITAGPDEDNLITIEPDTGEIQETDVFDPAGGEMLDQIVECDIKAEHSKPGRVFVRQSDPLPLSILAVMPRGDIGG